MSKHTPGPWAKYGSIIRDVCGGEDQIANVNVTDDEGQANAKLIAAAPDLLEALEGLLDNEKQSSFEYWISINSPSGDVESVYSQWMESSEYHEFLDLYSNEIAAVAKARGES